MASLRFIITFIVAFMAGEGIGRLSAILQDDGS